MKKLPWASPFNAAPYTKRLVFLRMALGILLCIKGYDFIHDFTPLEQLLARQQAITFPVKWLSLATGWIQIAGGVFIIAGFFTRLSCSVQLPVLTLVLLVQFSNYTLSDFEMIQNIGAFAGLTILLEKGGGKISLDRLFRLNQSEHIVFWA